MSTRERLPDWDANDTMWRERRDTATGFAQQILRTCAPHHGGAPETWRVLDVGSGWGFTSAALAKTCKEVLGAEPEETYFRHATDSLQAPNLRFIAASGLDVPEGEGPFDLIVLDNVYEHLPEQRRVLAHLATLLASGGMIYILVPNRLWPIEVHYHLPFLSWLPLKWANRYLRLTGKGRDYADSSYAPTYFSLQRDLDSIPELEWQFSLPADASLTQAGGSLLYRAGIGAIRRLPALWAISKAFLVVAVRKSTPAESQ